MQTINERNNFFFLFEPDLFCLYFLDCFSEQISFLDKFLNPFSVILFLNVLFDFLFILNSPPHVQFKHS